ncbi:MAG: OB-fold-containig protein [Paracoccaceae bacterium]
MLDPFLTAAYFPFTLSLGLLGGLLVLELVFALLGGTLLGAGGEGIDAPEVDVPELELDLDLDLDGLDIDPGDLELADMDAADTVAADTGASGVADWLGFGRMPAAIWLASMLMGFGLGGMTVQLLFTSVFSGPLPSAIAAIPAICGAVGFTRSFGSMFARLIPKTETEALSERHLGRRRGVISQGTAARGRPAEVRVIDRYGNTHYLRAEPLRDTARIPQGSEVIVLRHRRDGGYLLVPLTEGQIHQKEIE